MSDVLDWIAIGAWSAAVGVQVGAAIYAVWKGRRAITGVDRVRNGETVNGWRVAIPGRRQALAWVVGPGTFELPNNDYVEAIRKSELTILLWFDDASPNDQQRVFSILNRVQEKRLGGKRKLSHQQPNRRGNVPHQRDRVCRLALFDTVAKSHRLVTIEMPDAGENQTIAAMYPIAVRPGDVTRNRINVVFLACSYDDQSWYYDFYDCSYELPTSHDAAQIRPTSWESLSIPVGDRPIYRMQFHCPTVLLYNRDQMDDIDSYQMVWFDRRNTWRVEGARDWVDELRSTIHGKKLLNAVDSFRMLSHHRCSTSCDMRRLLVPLRYFVVQSITLDNFDGAVTTFTTNGGIWQRWLYPPSLKRIAAESFCRANPNMDFAQLKKAIGFDIFDGIFDAKDGDAPSIYLRYFTSDNHDSSVSAAFLSLN